MPSGEDKQPKQYEVTDANAMAIAMVGIGLSISVLIAFVIGVFLLTWYNVREPATQFRASDLALQHEPWDTKLRLQKAPGEILSEFKKEQAHLANGWSVLSEKPPIFRIPIEIAMDIVIENGALPDFTVLATEQGDD